jgi:hypothetical protein
MSLVTFAAVSVNLLLKRLLSLQNFQLARGGENLLFSGTPKKHEIFSVRYHH